MRLINYAHQSLRRGRSTTVNWWAWCVGEGLGLVKITSRCKGQVVNVGEIVQSYEVLERFFLLRLIASSVSIIKFLQATLPLIKLMDTLGHW